MSSRNQSRSGDSGRGGRGRNSGGGRNSGRGRGQHGRGRGGRGSGRGRGRGGQGNQPSSTTSSRNSSRNNSRKPTPTSSTASFKKNGEKGAEAHAVPESTRIRFTKMLLDMRENPDVEKLEMPTDLTNTERKFLHTLAIQIGLKSKSTGKGENRRIVISRLSNGKKIAGVKAGEQGGDEGGMDDMNLPKINVGPTGVQALQQYIHYFPPDDIELAEATETGSSFCTTYASGERKEGDSMLLDTLQKLRIQATSDIKRPKKSRKPINMQKRAERYHAAQDAKKRKSNYKQMQAMRSKLPAYSHQQEIVDIIKNSRVTILSGDTGCGKSTQVPQFILDSDPFCNIVVTQPRRISAISIAERVAQERSEDVGRTVGYSVRMEGASSNETQLLFLTPGVLLRRLQNSPELDEISHIIIDEIHERDKYTEFLMIALRELMNRRTDLHIVLMSATIQTNELRQYWNGTGAGIDDNIEDYIPAEISVPGRTFPVQSFYLEDVLTMTGILDDAKFGGELDDLEADLSALLSSNSQQVCNQNSNGNAKNKKKNAESMLIVSEHSLVCVMCNKGGFKCAEELGSHMGLCTGVSGIKMAALEKKVRCTEVRTTFGSSNTNEDIKECDEAIFEDDYDIGDTYNDDDGDGDDDDLLGMHEGRWDGDSPFGVADVIESSVKTTLTDEEMLNRYQMMHDDDQIDCDLILEVIRYINKSSYLDGAILVFLPGWQEISEITLLLESTHPFNNQNKFSILPLHSGIPSKEQRLVFQRPRAGVRKIILSTNIAETSVTIDDVAFVIDSGRAKEKNYDPHLKMGTLQATWISKASAKQRRGRAGRTKAGVCFHLFSRRRHESFRDFLESELLRTSLEEICLQCKKLDLTPGGIHDDDGIPAFLASAMTPPHPKSVSNALEKLVELGAMDIETNSLTPLGQCLSTLSVSPEVGKMTIWSYILGCSKDASSMAVAMSYKSPFVIPPSKMRRDADEARVELSQGTESDQVLVLKVLQDRDNFYKQGRKNQFFGYCKRNFINFATIQMVSDLRKNIARELTTIGFPDPSDLKSWYNRNGLSERSLPFLQSTIVAGVYPNVAARQAGSSNFSTSTNRKSKLHVGSVNACKGQPLARTSKMLEFIAYGEMVKGNALYTMNQTTHLATVLPIMLLCGSFQIRPAYAGKERQATDHSVMAVDEWISFQCEKSVATVLAILRRRLDAIFHHIVSNPKTSFESFSEMEKNTINVLDSVMQSSFYASPGRW